MKIKLNVKGKDDIKFLNKEDRKNNLISALKYLLKVFGWIIKVACYGMALEVLTYFIIYIAANSNNEMEFYYNHIDLLKDINYLGIQTIIFFAMILLVVGSNKLILEVGTFKKNSPVKNLFILVGYVFMFGIVTILLDFVELTETIEILLMVEVFVIFVVGMIMYCAKIVTQEKKINQKIKEIQKNVE